MGTDDRNRRLEPKIGVQHALFRVSRGYCYRPACPHPVLRRGDDGQPVVDVQIAHIYAASDNGPRGRPDLTVEERRAFSNLILLCGVHHQLVDKRENYETYPAPLLLA